MGRAHQYRQAITIRFNEDDDELIEWLGQYAQSSNMTKVVKLACYLLAGIQPQEGLLALMPEERFAHAAPARTHKTASTTRDIHATLTAVTQEMMALRQEISEQRLVQASEAYYDPTQALEWADQQNGGLHERGWFRPSPANTPPNPSIAASSGLDMSPRRKSARVMSGEPFSAVFDRQEAQRQLLASIKAYGQVTREGYRG